MRSEAFLAIWSDVPTDKEVDYLHWLTREHTAERLSVEGFRAVRVYRALLSDVNRYLIHYDLDSKAVLDSEGYLRRLNAPTPWSQRIMPILGNFIRGGGKVSQAYGTGHGSFVGAVRIQAPPYPTVDVLRAISGMELVANVRLLETDANRTTVRTKEKRMRQKDESFSGLLLVEGLTEAAVRSAMQSAALAEKSEYFRQIFQL